MLSAGAELPRKLRLLDTASLVVGTVIGNAIFLVPSIIARELHSPGPILGVWLFGGVLSFFGAIAFAELGAMLPVTGGQYVYLREAYGPLWAFLCGWTFFLVIQSGGLAGVAAAFTIYASQFYPLSPAAAKIVPVALIAGLTAVNVRGVRAGATVQNVLTAIKLLGLAILIGSAFLGGPRATVLASAASFSWRGLGVAMVAILWAYDGWNLVSCTAGEVENPQRNLPLALGLGMIFVTLVYLVINLAYMWVLGIPGMASAERVAAATAQQTLGPFGASLVTVTVLFSICGALNANILAPARLYFAQARDGLFFRRFGTIHPRFETPAFALLVQGVWASALVVSGSFETLMSYSMFGAWIFYGLAVLAVPVLRRKHPEWPRPYRMWGYPVTPLAFTAVSFWLVGSSIAAAPAPSLWGLLLIATGVPMYFVWRRR